MSLKPLLPGALSSRGQPITLGVMGGGQLGRMFVQAAQAMGYTTAVLDPDPASPAGLISHHHVQTAYDDPAGLAELARLCDAITTEFENVPAPALRQLAEIAPGGAVGRLRGRGARPPAGEGALCAVRADQRRVPGALCRHRIGRAAGGGVR